MTITSDCKEEAKLYDMGRRLTLDNNVKKVTAVCVTPVTLDAQSVPLLETIKRTAPIIARKLNM